MSPVHNPSRFPTEADLHAYVDGHLNRETRARIDAWLDRHPARAEEIRHWQRDAQQLRAAFGGLPDSAGAGALDPAVIRSRRRHRTHTRVALAAVLVLTLGLGGLGGWQARNLVIAATSTPMADAVEAYRMFAPRPHTVFDATQQHAGGLQAWFEQHFRAAVPLPDLAGAGFQPVGGRLLATGSGPAAMVLYEDKHGRVIGFYIRPPSPRTPTLPRGQRRDGPLVTAYWSDNGYNYALVSHNDAAGARAIREASGGHT